MFDVANHDVLNAIVMVRATHEQAHKSGSSSTKGGVIVKEGECFVAYDGADVNVYRVTCEKRSRKLCLRHYSAVRVLYGDIKTLRAIDGVLELESPVSRAPFAFLNSTRKSAVTRAGKPQLESLWTVSLSMVCEMGESNALARISMADSTDLTNIRLVPQNDAYDLVVRYSSTEESIPVTKQGFLSSTPTVAQVFSDTLELMDLKAVVGKEGSEAFVQIQTAAGADATWAEVQSSITLDLVWTKMVSDIPSLV